MNTARLPTTIDAYLEALRAALAGADPALVQDAQYDAEEFLRSELAEQVGASEADVIAKVASSYGAPDEVAAIYRDTEYKVRRAIEPPKALPRRSLAGRFFGVAVDPRTYGAVFYLLLSLATGIIYFTFVTTGLSLSAGLAVLIIGIPFFVIFLGLTRVLSLVEGRIVETMLGTRMPRRPLYSDRSLSWVERIKDMFTDARTWSTLLYLFIMMPLGILYFTLTVTGFSIALAFIAAPLIYLTGELGWLHTFHPQPEIQFGLLAVPPEFALPILFVAGVILLFAMLHLARGIGHVHGAIAKSLLVRSH
ncbi:MAG TPA: sensor domain-containing protein [Patescibacteria group bacterium]|nr:sensor domain-containing protein [Patescibacteria group bacterium]